jgi:hypothetical protein
MDSEDHITWITITTANIKKQGITVIPFRYILVFNNVKLLCISSFAVNLHRRAYRMYSIDWRGAKFHMVPFKAVRTIMASRMMQITNIIVCMISNSETDW